MREGFFRDILKLIVSVSIVSEVTRNSSVPVECCQSPTLSNGKVSPSEVIVNPSRCVEPCVQLSVFVKLLVTW